MKESKKNKGILIGLTTEDISILKKCGQIQIRYQDTKIMIFNGHNQSSIEEI